MIRNTISDRPIEKESQNPGSPFLVRISLDSSNSKFPFSNRPYILPGASLCAGSDAMHTRHSSSTTSYAELFWWEPQFSQSPRAAAPSSPVGIEKIPQTQWIRFLLQSYVQLHANAPKQTHDMQRENQKQEKTPGRWKWKENCQTNDGTGLDSIFAAWWQDTVPAAIQKLD